MTEDRFLDCLDLWGSDLSRWPAADQAAARDLVQRSALARDALARDRMLEEFLGVADPAVRLETGSLDRVKNAVFAAVAAESAVRRPVAGADTRSPRAGWLGLTERIRGWFDLPDPVAPWGLRLASVVLIAALLGSLTARSITLTTPTGTALEQIAMATPYTVLDVQ